MAGRGGLDNIALYSVSGSGMMLVAMAAGGMDSGLMGKATTGERPPNRPAPRPGEGTPRPCLILSAGAEMVTLALLEELLPVAPRIEIVELGSKSILRGVSPKVGFHHLAWPPLQAIDATVEALHRIVEQCAGPNSPPLPVFATEDGGLRLLFEARGRGTQGISCFGSETLEFSGLDKVELREWLLAAGFSDLVPPSAVLHDPSEFATRVRELGAPLVVKPSNKPFSMDLSQLGAKIAVLDSMDRLDEVERRLCKAWPIADRWLLERKLDIGGNPGEVSWYGHRTANGGCSGMMVRERWKYPRDGGSAAWVESIDLPEIEEIAIGLLTALRYRGLAEIAFARESGGRWRLIELNPRAWLQVALPGRCGCGMVRAAYLDLCDAPVDGVRRPPSPNASWVDPNRLLAAAVSGEYGTPTSTIPRALGALRRASCRAGYDSRLPGMRWRWLVNSLRRATGSGADR